MQQGQAIVGQATPHHREIAGVVPDADMLEHADGENPVEALIELAVILHAYLDRQAAAEVAGEFCLLNGNGDADATDAVAFGGEFQRFPPAATDVEHVHAGAQAELAADQIQFVDLRGIQCSRGFPITATVDKALAEHGMEQVVAEIVVAFADLEGTASALQVAQLGLDPEARIVDFCAAFVDVRIEQTEEEGIERHGIPLPIHVGLAQAERAMRDHACIEVFVMHADVPGCIAIDLDAAVGKQGGDASLQAGTRHCAVLIDARSCG